MESCRVYKGDLNQVQLLWAIIFCITAIRALARILKLPVIFERVHIQNGLKVQTKGPFFPL